MRLSHIVTVGELGIFYVMQVEQRLEKCHQNSLEICRMLTYTMTLG